MNELKTLESMGLVLPSPAYLVGAIIFGLIGYIAYRRGRKSSVVSVTWTGVALMLFPYVVPDTLLLYLIGGGLCISLYFSRRQGNGR